MRVHIGNIVINQLSPSKTSYLRHYLHSVELGSESPEELDRRTKNLKKLIRDLHFNITNISFPYHRYPKGTLNKKEDVYVIDAVINDEYAWEQNPSRKGKIYHIPAPLYQILKHYQRRLKTYKGQIAYDKGYYATNDPITSPIEQTTFPREVDKHFAQLKEVVLFGPRIKEMIDATFLLGYARKKEKQTIRLLQALLCAHDHTIHNMAARALFPKAILRKCDFIIPCAGLLNHNNFHCQNKYLGTAAYTPWTRKEKMLLKSKIHRIRQLVRSKQIAVAKPAKDILKKLSSDKVVRPHRNRR